MASGLYGEFKQNMKNIFRELDETGKSKSSLAEPVFESNEPHRPYIWKTAFGGS